MRPDDFEINGRQLSDVTDCDTNDKNPLKFVVLEVIAIKNGNANNIRYMMTVTASTP